MSLLEFTEILFCNFLKQNTKLPKFLNTWAVLPDFREITKHM